MNLIYGASIDSELVQAVLPAARVNPVLSAALNPILGYIEFDSHDARLQKDCYEPVQSSPAQPLPSTPAPNLDELLLLIDRGEKTAFEKICRRLAGDAEYQDEELLPGWDQLQPEKKTQIIRAAEIYLNGCCVVNTSWIEAGEVWYPVTCGYWALSLLAQTASQVFENLTDEVWHAWMPSAFAEHNQSEDLGEVEAKILKTAYQRAPSQFRKLFGRLIDAQNKCFEDAFVVNASTPVWDREIADLLRTKLADNKLRSRVFRRILAALLNAGDAAAIQIATDRVTGASSAPANEIDKAIEAALALLNHGASAAWKVVWPVVQKNTEFAQRLLTHYAIDPYSSDAARLRDGLQESELAELYIWLSQFATTLGVSEETGRQYLGADAFELNSSNRGWYWLSVAVMNALISRGTPAAVEAIRRINENTPDERLKHVEQMAQESVRQKTWTPLSPSELIDFVTGPRTIPTNAEGEPAGTPPDAKLSLATRLKEAEKVSDPKLRKMYEAVIRYEWYMKELRSLKVASKKYQTQAQLKQRFPDLDLWGALDKDDESDIASGDFNPGRFAWSLIKRLNNLREKDDRTLKNYRKALRAAGMSV